jgi:hypothetical protein
VLFYGFPDTGLGEGLTKYSYLQVRFRRDSGNVGRDSGNVGRDSGNVGRDSGNVGNLPTSLFRNLIKQTRLAHTTDNLTMITSCCCETAASHAAFADAKTYA